MASNLYLVVPDRDGQPAAARGCLQRAQPTAAQACGPRCRPGGHCFTAKAMSARSASLVTSATICAAGA